MPSRPPPWSRQELILALELYFDVGAADYRSSRRVQELSGLIRAMHAGETHLEDTRFRSPSSVSRKLKNIAWVDPSNTRGTAQSHGSAVDEEIWDEFADDRGRLAVEAAAIRAWIESGFQGPTPTGAATTEVGAALDAIHGEAGKRTRGQGYMSSAAARLTLERHSMETAARYFADLGWSSITDVSQTRCFDLLCLRDDEELRVEVKATTTAGTQVLLTRNEVTHARRVFPRVALYVLAGIELVRADDASYRASGGTAINRNPWDIRSGELQPLAYAYDLPSG
jgi:uncharacterized protein DUF3883